MTTSPQRPQYADEAGREDKPLETLDRKRPEPLQARNSFDALIGGSRALWNRFSEEPQNEALLTWENGEKVDRR